MWYMIVSEVAHMIARQREVFHKKIPLLRSGLNFEKVWEFLL